ncbi:MAG: NAD-dependent epimerase/dehydratase family protein [Candidatus Harrisonbacteria bacterium]|nr:NAD-dependent epimerase/dehydratase family protein [Candidatus Harrisonbacteria bacterium]
MPIATPVLITGASGFVGANLLRRLVNNGLEKKTNIILRKNSDPWRIKDVLKKAPTHIVDLRNEEATRALLKKIKPKTIFHLATHGAYPRQQFEEKEIMETNITCAFNLMNSAARTGVKSFINTGTSSEYGINKMAMREQDRLSPVTAYGASKAWATLYGNYLANDKKFPVTTLRLFGVYGYYEPRGRLIPNIILSFLENSRPKLTNPKFIRDFVFIEDVVDAYIMAAERNIAGSILNVGSGRKTSLQEVFTVIKEIMNSDVRPILEKSKTGIPDINRRVADVQLAKKTLKWKPKTNLRDGLRKTVNWFKDNLDLYEHH